MSNSKAVPNLKQELKDALILREKKSTAPSIFACAASSSSHPYSTPLVTVFPSRESFDENKYTGQKGITSENLRKTIASRKEVPRGRGETAAIRREEVNEGRKEDVRYQMVEEVRARYSKSNISTSKETASDLESSRKSNKPQMEKKRRQREKQSLNKLREYVLAAFKVDPSKYMDKAEILEKTVKFMDHIVNRHYPKEDTEWNKASKLLENPTNLINNSDNKTENFREPDVYNLQCKSTDQNMKLHSVNSNNGQFGVSCPTIEDHIVTLILPQLGYNFQMQPNIIHSDASNNCWSGIQSGTQQEFLNDSLPDKEKLMTSPTMKFIINYNYCVNTENGKCDDKSPNLAEQYSREVRSPDTTTSDNNFQDGHQGTIASDDGLETRNMSVSPRRIAPKCRDFSDTMNSQHAHSRSISVHPMSRPSSSLHRPWEK